MTSISCTSSSGCSAGTDAHHTAVVQQAMNDDGGDNCQATTQTVVALVGEADPISELERAQIQSIRQTVGNDVLHAVAMDDDTMVLLRFVRRYTQESRHNPQQAMKHIIDRIRATIQWRQTMNIEQLQTHPPTDDDCTWFNTHFMGRLIHNGNTRDRFGHPVILVRLDHSVEHIDALHQRWPDPARLQQQQLWWCEQLEHSKREASVVQHHTVYKHTVIVDTRDASLADFWRWRAILSEFGKWMQQHFPETLYRNLVIADSRVVRWVYSSMVAPFLVPLIRQKTVVDTTAAIRQECERDGIPWIFDS